MRARTICMAAIGALLAGCAGMGGGAAEQQAGRQPARQVKDWPISTRYHLDLWLHGYALVQADTTLVPYFKRGYAEQLTALKNRANVFTELDRYRTQLREGLSSSPELIGGQFLPLYFNSWDEMLSGIDTFLRAEGKPAASQPPEVQRVIAIIGASYPSAADRAWLRTFTNGLSDESTKFFQSYWNQQQRDRSAAMAALDSLWKKVYLPKFHAYLNNTRQNEGELLVSLPLDGEGRTITDGPQSNLVAVTYPEQAADALDAIYVFTHEVVGTLANQVIADNTTPAEKRDGTAARYASPAAVRGGVIVLQKIAPELVKGYTTYYLRSANVSFRAGTEEATLARVFPLPEAMLYGMQRQLEIVFGGI